MQEINYHFVSANVGEYEDTLKWDVMAYKDEYLARVHATRLNGFFDKLIYVGRKEGLLPEETLANFDKAIKDGTYEFPLDPMVTCIWNDRPLYRVESRIVRVGESEADIPDMLEPPEANTSIH